MNNNLLIYKNKNGNVIVDAIYKDETLWLTQKEMAKVFDVNIPAISKHLDNIYESNELDKKSAISKIEIVQNKLNYVVTGHTAIELIYERADHTKENMNLTNLILTYAEDEARKGMLCRSF